MWIFVAPHFGRVLQVSSVNPPVRQCGPNMLNQTAQQNQHLPQRHYHYILAMEQPAVGIKDNIPFMEQPVGMVIHSSFTISLTPATPLRC